MKHSCLEITYRKGRGLAAYDYLPREDEGRSVRAEHVAPGLLFDFSLEGTAIGVEISFPSHIDLAALNGALVRFGHELVRPDDLSPQVAA